MRQLPVILLLLFFYAFSPLERVSVKDFKPAFGSWAGTLTYLDYSSGKSFSMPAKVIISRDKTNKHQLILAFNYPDEPKANANDTLVISKDGLAIDGAMVISKEVTNSKGMKIITEKEGVDGNDNRKAIIRHLYIITKTTFLSRKEVKFEGFKEFILRNEFSLRR